MRTKKITNIISAALAVGLVCISSVQNANAYFTTHVTAKGGYEVSWRHREEITEKFVDWNKYITITSEDGSVPVYVRVKAFAGNSYQLVYEGTGWTYNNADGYCYYDSVLQGGGTATGLRVGINNVPVNPKEGMDFNVVVVYETIPVQYGTDGSMVGPEQADWTQRKTSQEAYNE